MAARNLLVICSTVGCDACKGSLIAACTGVGEEGGAGSDAGVLADHSLTAVWQFHLGRSECYLDGR